MHLLDGNLQAVGDDHRERGRVALAVRGCPDPYRRRPVGVHGDRAVLGASSPRRDLDVRAHADPERHPIAAASPFGLFAAQLVVSRDSQRLGQRGVVVAAVVLGPHHRRVREFVGAEKIPPAHLGRIDLELGRGDVDDAFEHGRSFRTARAGKAPIGVVLVNATAHS